MRAEQITTTDAIWERVCIKAEEVGLIPAELAGVLLTYAVLVLMNDNERTSKERTPASSDDRNLPPQHDG